MRRNPRSLQARTHRKNKRISAIALAAFSFTAYARADVAPLDTHADEVTLDAKQRDLELRGHVTVESPPFHLSSDALTLKRTPRGVDVDGSGRLAFCPCLGTPLTLGFAGAIVAPPGDLVLRSPTLDVYGVPIFWLPYFWLRSPARIGLLPPDVMYRGKDGLFLGEGIHLPWKLGDARNGLDLRAGAYSTGGSAFSGELRTAVSVTKITWDHKDGDGVLIDARGALEDEKDQSTKTAVGWDIDVLRGARGVVSTTDLDAAARVIDRASADAAVRDGGWTLSSGVRTAAFRGGAFDDFGVAGPAISLRRAEAIRGAGDYDITLGGGALHSQDAGATLAFARGEAGALLATRFGAVGADANAHVAGDLVDDGFEHGADGAAEARGEITLPLVRAFDSGDAGDRWRHRIEPRAAVAALLSRGDDLIGSRFGRGLASVRGDAYLAETGVASAIGRWGANEALEASASVGAIGGTSQSLAMRWRANASSTYFGLGAEGAHLAAADFAGSAFVARSRVGAIDSLHLGVNVAARAGVDPVAARLLTDAPLEPSAGFFATEGWTSGSNVTVPWSTWLSTSAGGDADLTNQLLVAARGGIELRDKCQCFALRLTGAHRIGREGVDVWLTIDLAPRLR